MEKTINDFLREYDEGKMDDELCPSDKLHNCIFKFLYDYTMMIADDCHVMADELIDKLEQGGFLT